MTEESDTSSDVLEGSRCMVPFQWDHECLSISLFVGPLWENTTEIFLLLIFYSVFDSRKTYRVAFCLHTFIVCVYIQIYMYCLCVYMDTPALVGCSSDSEHKSQQIHNSLLIFTDLSSLPNHNCSLYFVTSDYKAHCHLTLPHNSEYWSWTSH